MIFVKMLGAGAERREVPDAAEPSAEERREVLDAAERREAGLVFGLDDFGLGPVVGFGWCLGFWWVLGWVGMRPP